MCLIARHLAEWVVRGAYARLIEPPKHENGWVVRGTYKSLQSLQELKEDQALPSAELPGLKFEEPLKRRRLYNPNCALMTGEARA